MKLSLLFCLNFIYLYILFSTAHLPHRLTLGGDMKLIHTNVRSTQLGLCSQEAKGSKDKKNEISPNKLV